MGKIITLSKELINHIAAGEVVERPASVLKELLENAIDAGSDKISVKVGQGGIEHIEVSDNGSGIEPDDLENAVQPHSTSKINSVDDLSHIETLGFRGEALASVAAISKLSILTKTEASSTAQMMVVTGGEIAPVKMASRDTGTTIRVEDLFHAVPARKKFLKQPKTEYRKIIDVFVPLALMHPEIHWTLESDGRIVHTLPSIAGTLGGSLHPQRVFELLPGIEFVEVFYDGEGIVVGGMVGHPSHKAPRVSERYVFVNGRPVWDNGIAKAVMMGSARFIPEGMRVPFLISLNISHDQVDVNVHPRKMEVRFANPYRVYSAVESAVRKAYEDNVRESLSSDEPHRLRRGGAGEDISNEGGREHTLSDSFENRSTTQSFRESTHAISRPVNPHTVEESLSFSKLILSDASQEGGTGVLPQESSKSPEIDPDTVVSARQYLNRYVIAQLNDAILIIDQHAAAERIRFEKLLRDYEDRGIESQTLMLPLEIRMSSKELLFVGEYSDLFPVLGFEIEVHDDHVTLKSVPAVLSSGNHEELMRSVVSDIMEIEEFSEKDAKLTGKYRDSVIATMACHSSVRMNQRISEKEAANLVKELFSCRNAYACPHGRPIVWRLTPAEIDRHFDR